MKSTALKFVFAAALTLQFAMAATAKPYVKVNKEQYRESVKAHLKEVRTCYEQSLNADPNGQGKVVMDWAINDQGQVTSAKMNQKKSSLLNPEIANCLLEKSKAWKFPPAPIGLVVTVSFPFEFNTTK